MTSQKNLCRREASAIPLVFVSQCTVSWDFFATYKNAYSFALDSPVFTPEDSELWLKAKHIFQVADFAHAEVIEHLFKLHLFLEPICVCLHRHLSKLHPVHEMMKQHCRGLIGSNKFGYPFLMSPGNGSMDKLLTIGSQGAVQMMFRASQEVTWDDTDFLANIKVGTVINATFER